MITGKVNWGRCTETCRERDRPDCAVKHVSEGRNSEISVIVRTDNEAIFVKGRKADHPQAWAQDRERIINPYVRHISPRLKWSSSNDEWELLGFEYIPGAHVNYAPGSADISKVLRTLRQLQEIPPPDIQNEADQRWAAYTSTPELLACMSNLLHTDWPPATSWSTTVHTWSIGHGLPRAQDG